MSEESGGEPIERVAVHDGVEHPAMIRWGTRQGPHGHLLYEIEVDGPFPVARGEGPDLFAALQRARRILEGSGWLLAVEGSRRQTHPSGMQRDQGGGLVAYQLDTGRSRAYPQRSILERADPADCVTVVEQERWYEQWLARRPLSAEVVSGRGWSIVNPDLTNGRRGYRPVAAGEPQESAGIPIVYGDRIDALAAGDDEPLAVPLERLGRTFPHGVVLDPGQTWTWQGIPVVLRKPPRLELGAEEHGGPMQGALPGVRVFGIRNSAARLVLLPSGASLRSAAETLAGAVGAAVVPPLVLVVAGAEPRAARRALKGLLG